MAKGIKLKLVKDERTVTFEKNINGFNHKLQYDIVNDRVLYFHRLKIEPKKTQK